MSDNKTGMPQGDILHDRFVRWQRTTREHLSYAINLTLGFSAATIGFQITLVLNDHFFLVGAERCFFLIGMFLVAIAMIPGFAAIVTRLCDFRLTTLTARSEWDSKKTKSQIAALRLCTDCLGEWSWRLFWTQLVLFAIGIGLIAAVLFLFAMNALG